ncbi:MAG TPA: hypothetical protein VGH15_03700 [Caulobacteraceae bacterium]
MAHARIARRIVLAMSGCALPAGGAGAAGGPQGSAQGIEVTLDAQGIATQLGPIAAVEGPSTGKYDVSKTVASASETVIAAPLISRPSAHVTATNLTSHAAASGWGVDARSSAADAAVGSGRMNLFTDPAGPSGLPAVLYLAVSVQEALSTASFSQVAGGSNYADGSARIGALNVSGQLLGGASVKFAGPAPANKIIYQSPSLTITVNRQIRSETITCAATCQVTPTAIDVAAVDVELHDAMVGGTRISGHILVADDTAQ